MMGRADGNIEIWDLLESLYAPIYLQSVSLYAIARICISMPTTMKHSHQLLLVGDDFGNAFTYEVPRKLSKAFRNEPNMVKNVLERQLIQQSKVVRLSRRAVRKPKSTFEAEKYNAAFTTTVK